MLSLPKFTPVRVKSAAEQDSKAYVDLVTAYASHNAEKLRKCIEQHTAVYNAVSSGRSQEEKSSHIMAH